LRTSFSLQSDNFTVEVNLDKLDLKGNSPFRKALVEYTYLTDLKIDFESGQMLALNGRKKKRIIRKLNSTPVKWV